MGKWKNKTKRYQNVKKKYKKNSNFYFRVYLTFGNFLNWIDKIKTNNHWRENKSFWMPLHILCCCYLLHYIAFSYFQIFEINMNFVNLHLFIVWMVKNKFTIQYYMYILITNSYCTWCCITIWFFQTIFYYFYFFSTNVYVSLCQLMMIWF